MAVAEETIGRGSGGHPVTLLFWAPIAGGPPDKETYAAALSESGDPRPRRTPPNHGVGAAPAIWPVTTRTGGSGRRYA